MNVLVAPDSFKDSLTATQAARVIAQAIAEVQPSWRVVQLPLADGGEGTVEALATAWGVMQRSHPGKNARGYASQVVYAVDSSGKQAVMELASGAGLQELPSAQRQAIYTTTYGFGEALAHVCTLGVKRVYVGLGGSATNDGGAGIVAAFGGRLLDKSGQPVPPLGGQLHRVATLDVAQLAVPPGVELVAAVDVDNPLLGPRGATAVYGPQKGANTEALHLLECGLENWAGVVAAATGRDLSSQPGMGAAGGAGFGVVSVLGGRMMRGFDLWAKASELSERLSNAQLVITGEGHADHQSLSGKGPVALAERASAAGAQVWLLAGGVSGSHQDFLRRGVTQLRAITPEGMPLEQALAKAGENLKNQVKKLVQVAG